MHDSTKLIDHHQSNLLMNLPIPTIRFQHPPNQFVSASINLIVIWYKGWLSLKWIHRHDPHLSWRFPHAATEPMIKGIK